jgi:hypothetical protein
MGAVLGPCGMDLEWRGLTHGAPNYTAPLRPLNMHVLFLVFYHSALRGFLAGFLRVN